jgi:hypothetical protein
MRSVEANLSCSLYFIILEIIMDANEFLTPTSQAQGALFNVPAGDRKDNGPVMTGSIKVENQKILVSGFLKTATTTGMDYLSLSLSAPLPENHTDQDRENQLRYYGKLFRQTERRSDSSPDYTGFISVLPCVASNQYTDKQWDDAQTLQVWGWRKRNTDGKSRIAINIAPREVAPDELNF